MSIGKRIDELRSLYRDVTPKTLADGSTLVRINAMILPLGCKPEKTNCLLVFPSNQDTPSARYVKDKIVLPNGVSPDYSSTLVDGEPWYNFSYNFPWNQNDPMYQYLESLLSRFAKPK